MAWIAPIIAAGPRKRGRKQSKAGIWLSMVILLVGSLVPLGLIFLMNFSGELNGGFFPILFIGIMVIALFGIMFVAFASNQFEDDDEEFEPDYDSYSEARYRRQRARRSYQREPNREDFHWGSKPTPSDKSFCSQCGTRLEFDDQFCSSCGRRLNFS
ncbi:MAG: hypothetical protein ACXAC8_16915 [Candidatus Hodarchaeales archaeon]|jgi:hypothetical protein